MKGTDRIDWMRKTAIFKSFSEILHTILLTELQWAKQHGAQIAVAMHLQTISDRRDCPNRWRRLPTLPTCAWKVTRTIKLVKSQDTLIRAVELWLRNAHTWEQPVNQLYPIDINMEEKTERKQASSFRFSRFVSNLQFPDRQTTKRYNKPYKTNKKVNFALILITFWEW